MALTDAAQIGSNDTYVGNAGLGAVNGGAIQIDTRPLMQLGMYVNAYGQKMWEQKQKETDAKIKELADLSQFSLNDLRAKDKEQGTEEFSVLLGKASEYARKDPKNSQERIQNELEWQTELGKFKNNFNSGKQRKVSYMAQLNAINASVTDQKTKDILISKLDEKFDNTDIGTEISSLSNYPLQKFDVPTPVPSTFSSVAVEGNNNIKVAGKIYNPKVNAGIADATILGVKNAYGVPKTIKDESGNTIPNPQYGEQQELQSVVSSSGKEWVDAAEVVNSALKAKDENGRYLYINDDGSFNSRKFEDENASNITLMKPFNALKNYDQYNRNHYRQASSPLRMFDDKGVNVPLPENVVADDFKVGFVDFAKGVNPNQLVQSGMFAQFAGDEFKKEIVHTGDARALQQERMRQAGQNYREGLQQGGQNYREKLKLLGKGFGFDDKGKLVPAKGKTGKPDDIILKPAQLLGQHIERLKKKFSDDKTTESVIVKYKAVDPYTKDALGLSGKKLFDAQGNETGEIEAINYKKDGSYELVDKDGKVLGLGTIENLAQGYINAANKSLTGSKSGVPEGFQVKSEAAMAEVLGSSSGKDIWDNWSGTKDNEAQSESGVTYGGKTYSMDEVKAAAKQFGMSADDYIKYLKSL